MAPRKKSTAVKDSVVEDIARAEELLANSNKKLLSKISRYEEEIHLLREEVTALKKHSKATRVDKLSAENKKLATLAEKLQKSEHTAKKLSQEMHKKLKEAHVRVETMTHEMQLLKDQLHDKEETLHTQDKVLAARKNESKLMSDVNRKLREHGRHKEKNMESIADIVTQRSIEIRQLRRLVQKTTEELHELKNEKRKNRERIIALNEQNMNERRVKVVMAQKIENLKASLTQKKQHTVDNSQKIKDLEDMLAVRIQECEKHLTNIKILTEDSAEKERVISRLNSALATRKEEAALISDINKRLIEKDKELNANQRNVQELMLVKDERSKQYKRTVDTLAKQLEAARQSHAKTHKEFEHMVKKLTESNENVRMLESEKRRLTGTLLKATRAHEKQLQEINGFKSQVRRLFGVNKDMENKTLRFSEYLEKLRHLLHKKQLHWNQKEDEYKEEVEILKRESDEKIRTIMKEETDTIISLKSAIVRLKEDLKEKEEELIRRDIKERDMMLEMTRHLKGWYDTRGEDIPVSGIPLSDIEGVSNEVTEALMQKEQQIRKDLMELQMLKNQNEGRLLGELQDHIIIADREEQLQEPEPRQPIRQQRRREAPRRREPPREREKPRQAPVRQPLPRPAPLPPVQPRQSPRKQMRPTQDTSDHHEILRRTKEKYAPKAEGSGSRINLRKYYHETEVQDGEKIMHDLEEVHETKHSEPIFIEGDVAPQRKRDEKFKSKAQEAPALDLSISYTKNDPLISMVDIGLQQGDDIDTIKDSLIKTGYDKEDVERVISLFKKGRLGSL